MKVNNIGVFGLGVMGQNLALNFSNKGFTVSVINRITPEGKRVFQDFIRTKTKNTNISGYEDIKSFICSLEKPRKIIIMVKAGSPVDSVISDMTPLLENNDIIIDGGNSHFKDTKLRFDKLKSLNIKYIGCGISGGSSGALNGPSMMPGGDKSAWADIKDMFRAICAQYNGEYCCNWVGSGGAGHFVKMVHNGIEYAVMQMIAEAYDIQKRLLNMSNKEISDNFAQWNKSELKSYLIEITSEVLVIEDKDNRQLIDNILDCSNQKGTGRWASILALELGVPSTTINEAVNARYISSVKEIRSDFSDAFSREKKEISNNKEDKLGFLKDALYCSFIVAYSQGIMLIQAASKQYRFDIDLNSVIKTWRRGCIIESDILANIAKIELNNDASNVLLTASFVEIIEKRINNWRNLVLFCIENALPVSSISSALTFFDSMCSETLPANLIQAQRDYFGYHGFERTDSLKGKYHHIEEI